MSRKIKIRKPSKKRSVAASILCLPEFKPQAIELKKKYNRKRRYKDLKELMNDDNFDGK